MQIIDVRQVNFIVVILDTKTGEMNILTPTLPFNMQSILFFFIHTSLRIDRLSSVYFTAHLNLGLAPFQVLNSHVSTRGYCIGQGRS